MVHLFHPILKDLCNIPKDSKGYPFEIKKPRNYLPIGNKSMVIDIHWQCNDSNACDTNG